MQYLPLWSCLLNSYWIQTIKGNETLVLFPSFIILKYSPLPLIYTVSIVKLGGYQFYMNERVLFIYGATKLNWSFNFTIHITAFIKVELYHVSVSQIAFISIPIISYLCFVNIRISCLGNIQFSLSFSWLCFLSRPSLR